jgi:hypothetical protein
MLKKTRGTHTMGAPPERCRLRANGPLESNTVDEVIKIKRALPEFQKALCALRALDVPSVKHLPLPRRKPEAKPARKALSSGGSPLS